MMQRQVLRGLLVGVAVVFVLGLGVLAQSVSLTVTTYSDAVRFSAQGSVKELRVEIISLAGQKIFDSGAVNGVALDWKMLNMQGQPVASGVYLYTVTMKDEFGNVTKKLGKLALVRGKAGQVAPPLTLLSGPTVGEVAQNPRLQPLVQTINDNLRVNAPAGVNIVEFYTDSGSIERSHIRPTGLQRWFLNSGTSEVGRIEFSTPTSVVGIVYRDVAGASRSDFRHVSGGGFAWAAHSGSTAPPEWMRLTADGNLGIGTSSPSAKTHINNTANQPGLRIDSSSGTNALEIYNTGSGSATGLIFRVERTTGNVYAAGSITGGGADVAERIDTTEPLEAGDVVEIDPDNPGKFRKAREAISHRVAGVISTAPGVILGNQSAKSSDTRPILALAGRVPVKVTAKYGAIQVGDLLVSSPIPGYAMRCPEKSQCVGAVIGKALEPLTEGTGVIEVQVMLR